MWVFVSSSIKWDKMIPKAPFAKDLNSWETLHNSLKQQSADFFCKWSESKHFRLCGHKVSAVTTQEGPLQGEKTTTDNT